MVATAVYLVIVLASILTTWILATGLYLLLRRKGLIPSVFYASTPPSTPGRGGLTHPWAPGLFAPPRRPSASAVRGGGMMRQVWKVSVGECPEMEEVMIDGKEDKRMGEEEVWKPIAAHLLPASLTLTFLVSFPQPPPSHLDESTSTSPSALPDLDLATLSIPLPPRSQLLDELLPLSHPTEGRLRPGEKMVAGVRMRREWVREDEPLGQRPERLPRELTFYR